MGTLYWAGQSDPQKPQEYTVSVKNSIGQILQTKVMLNFERPPEGLGVSNFALIQVNQYNKVYVGDYISTAENDLAKVYHKTYAKYGEDENPKYKYYLMVKLLRGTFSDKEEIDHFKNFSRSVATVIGERKLVNNILTIESPSFGQLDQDGNISNSDQKYVAYNSSEDTATLQMTSTPLQTIEVVNPYQFSVGLQVVDESDNSAVVMGIYRSVDEAKTYVVVQPTKGVLVNNKRLQIGRSSFDQTEESADYIITSTVRELKNIFILSSGESPAKIDDLYNVTNPSSMKISQNKDYQTSSTSTNIISLWSPMLKIWSMQPEAGGVAVDDGYAFSAGSDIYTYSRLSGVVNKRYRRKLNLY